MTWQYREGFHDISTTLKQQTLKYVHCRTRIPYFWLQTNKHQTLFDPSY